MEKEVVRVSDMHDFYDDESTPTCMVSCLETEKKLSQTLYNMELQQLVRDDSCAEPRRPSSGSCSSLSVIDMPSVPETPPSDRQSGAGVRVVVVCVCDA